MKPTVLLFLMGWCGTGFSQIQTNEGKAILRQVQTRGFYNGRYWAATSDSGKNNYIIGFLEGLSEASPEAIRRYDTGELSVNEVRAAIDRFYTQPENTLIPVFEAFQIVGMRIHGASESVIDARLSVFRKFANEPQEQRGK
jgi:hypothetical protein